jgi:hypothetical protein
MKVHIACFTALLIQIPHLTTGTAGNADNAGGSHSMSDRRDDKNTNLIKEAYGKNYIDSASRNMIEDDTNIFGAADMWKPTKHPTTKIPTTKRVKT